MDVEGNSAEMILEAWMGALSNDVDQIFILWISPLPACLLVFT